MLDKGISDLTQITNLNCFSLREHLLDQRPDLRNIFRVINILGLLDLEISIAQLLQESLAKYDGLLSECFKTLEKQGLDPSVWKVELI